MKLTNTPVTTVQFNGYTIHVKRDDLLHPDFSGNKARKLYYLLQQDLTGIERLVSYGSVQANSLHSMAALAKLKGVELDYYVAPIPAWLKDNPSGNYLAALNNDANIIEVAEKPKAYIERNVQTDADGCLFVPEGGHCAQAEVGVGLLADELVNWAKEQRCPGIKIMLPAGTGTTALFLQKSLRGKGLDFEVMTCACVGDEAYLEQQFTELCSDKRNHPTILPRRKKYHFGKLYPEFYELWQQLNTQTGMEFDLLYDPLGWQCLLDGLASVSSEVPLVYIHQGGLQGNATMLARYQRKARLKTTTKS